MRSVFGDQIRKQPAWATGRIGSPSAIAVAKAPFLKAWNAPSRLLEGVERPVSGPRSLGVEEHRDLAGSRGHLLADALDVAGRVRALHADAPGQAERVAEDRDRHHLALDDEANREWGEPGEQARRVPVALVVRDDDVGLARHDVVTALHLELGAADAQTEAREGVIEPVDPMPRRPQQREQDRPRAVQNDPREQQSDADGRANDRVEPPQHGAILPRFGHNGLQ
jgi:hypothetical protein